MAIPDMVSLFAGTVLNQAGQAIETIAMTMSVYLIISLTISLLMNICITAASRSLNAKES
ncbi:hypothetical protein DMI62_10725 [Escherichia coli]|nr:hypothetical protein [Escherichia coli]